MVWCSYCAKDQVAEADDINGFTCCTGCGRVLDDNVYSSDPTFTKGADGQSSVQGNFVRDRQYGTYNVGGEGHQYATDSHERTLERGRDEIRDISDFLAMSSREDAVNAAHRLYIIAVERNFTRGRRTIQVAAACLYIICRQEQKPFLLIDFSDCLQTNVYVLGAVFLQLCRLLSLEQHPIIQKPVDPSLFIHRFTDRLLRRSSVEGKRNIVAQTALRLVASMKRDWMQTGRRPSGICGAALFISAHIHGFECTKTDVVSVVHICEGTLTKRLIEFENTESGSLTAEEFESRAEEFQSLSQTPRLVCSKEIDREVLCEHKAQGAAHYAVGLCKTCYDEFIRVSGGMEGGAAPPAFQASERKREAEKKKLQEQQLLLSASDASKLKAKLGETQSRKLPDDKPRAMRGQIPDVARVKAAKNTRLQKAVDHTTTTGPSISESASQISEIIDGHRSQDPPDKSDSSDLEGKLGKASEMVLSCIEESEAEAERTKDGNPTETFVNHFMTPPELDDPDNEDTLSDIDDDEVDGYLHNQEEIRLKTIIWTEMNKEYLEEQQAKQDALAASQAAHAAALAAGDSDSASAIELAAAAAAAVAELRKDRKRKRDEAKSKGPAESATEATRQMLQSKKLSSKVNYSALEKLFDGEVTPEATKKVSEDEKKNEQRKDKHVKWADTDGPNGLGGKQDLSATEVHTEGDVGGKEEVEDDEDEEEGAEEGDAINIGDDQNYGLPYVDDYEEDGYDEY
ncbi:hypothetical protein GOP47_0011314 [Adiantum capillus-veneris]|uniref:Cyclin-like domain-containing protein n=1 Tax=Adiantum capillus-veneris TaxID=13818 RepID=A0A9D4ZHR1_ADICA|nr:hypothetical protein GOP47_0011314 [Adiantum capillus-veneris]